MSRGRNQESYSATSIAVGAVPMIEMVGNRNIMVEGSTGILLYESENIKINTNKMVVSFSGRNLTVRCISNSCVEITGFITKVEFMT
ncbi:MAG: YabP/YqfC family sporulation protein [Ruminococcus sp.]|nr:YabP/YqfC family sporulation protein [Ruminococcus sp.]